MARTSDASTRLLRLERFEMEAMSISKCGLQVSAIESRCSYDSIIAIN
jgi:hypothetical protein